MYGGKKGSNYSNLCGSIYFHPCAKRDRRVPKISCAIVNVSIESCTLWTKCDFNDDRCADFQIRSVWGRYKWGRKKLKSPRLEPSFTLPPAERIMFFVWQTSDRNEFHRGQRRIEIEFHFSSTWAGAIIDWPNQSCLFAVSMLQLAESRPHENWHTHTHKHTTFELICEKSNAAYSLCDSYIDEDTTERPPKQMLFARHLRPRSAYFLRVFCLCWLETF